MNFDADFIKACIKRDDNAAVHDYLDSIAHKPQFWKTALGKIFLIAAEQGVDVLCNELWTRHPDANLNRFSHKFNPLKRAISSKNPAAAQWVIATYPDDVFLGLVQYTLPGLIARRDKVWLQRLCSEAGRRSPDQWQSIAAKAYSSTIANNCLEESDIIFGSVSDKSDTRFLVMALKHGKKFMNVGCYIHHLLSKGVSFDGNRPEDRENFNVCLYHLQTEALSKHASPGAILLDLLMAGGDPAAVQKDNYPKEKTPLHDILEVWGDIQKMNASGDRLTDIYTAIRAITDEGVRSQLFHIFMAHCAVNTDPAMKPSFTQGIENI